MDIQVTCPGPRTYGTGETAKKYVLKPCLHRKYGKNLFARVSFELTFEPRVKGYRASDGGLPRDSNAFVSGARIEMTLNEAEQFARILLWTIEHSKIHGIDDVSFDLPER